MRITAKITTAGVAGLSRFPVPNASIDECLGPDGRLDETKARRALAVDQVQTASTDTRRVFAFALEYLAQTRSVVEHMASDLGPDGATVCPEGVHTAPASKRDRACERRMNRGSHAYCRTDVTDCADGIHVRLSVQNPREVVGNAERFAYEYAVMCARILLYLRRSVGAAAIVLIEGDGAKGVFADAAALDRRCALRDMRDVCGSRVNGCYCSPIRPDCPLYENGRCKEP